MELLKFIILNGPAILTFAMFFFLILGVFICAIISTYNKTKEASNAK